VNLAHWIAWVWVLVNAGTALAVTTLSDGHIDVFELHYDSSVSPTEFALHIHDHVSEAHFEPADVILQVNESSYFASPAGLISILGSAAYILPATEESDMLYGGVSATGPTGCFRTTGSRSKWCRQVQPIRETFPCIDFPVPEPCRSDSNPSADPFPSMK